MNSGNGQVLSTETGEIFATSAPASGLSVPMGTCLLKHLATTGALVATNLIADVDRLATWANDLCRREPCWGITSFASHYFTSL